MAFDIISFLIGQQSAKGGGGGSSGGGSLPAGIYLTTMKSASIYRYKVFKYAGELYAIAAKVANAGYANAMLKYNAETDTWETLMTSANNDIGIGGSTIDSVGWKGIEYNGKFHIFDRKQHYIFDGTNFTISTEIPSGMTPFCGICNGKLYVYMTSSYFLYEWDEANSAWINGVKINNYPSGFFVKDNEFYFSSTSALYKYVDGSLIQLYSIPSFREWYFANGVIYGRKYVSSQQNELYKLDLTSGETVLMGLLPSFSNYYPSENTDDISFTGLTYTDTTSCVPFFKVNIVE